jgi:SAM-dependent methyltransferase
MDSQIIGLHAWLNSPAGQLLLQWERERLAAAVADVFGYHALQLGLPEIAGLEANRMPHQWLAVGLSSNPMVANAQLVTDFAALPFASASLDLLVLPHTLEFSPDPHATLREVARVLVPEGRVVVCGLNPASLWGWAQQRARWYKRFGFGQLYLPEGGDFIGYWRLRDWLRLLSFEVESSNFGVYQPAMRTQPWLLRLNWLNALGRRWWPILGAAYCVVAVKKVHGARLLGTQWKKAPSFANAPVSIARKDHLTMTSDKKP